METTSPSSHRNFGVPIAIIALGALLGGALLLQNLTPVASSPTASPTPTDTVVPRLTGVPLVAGLVTIGEHDPVLGSADAPTTVFLFTQWHCPFCRHFFEATLPQIKEKFIDTGRVRLVFKVFPMSDDAQNTEQTQQLVQAAYCAEEQGKFWDYNRHLFAAGAGYAASDLTRYAQEEGLAEDEFMVCLERGEYAEVVADTIRTALAAGITGTPALVINDQLYEGALSYAEFERLVQ